MKEVNDSKQMLISRRMVISVILVASILLCAFFTRVYTAMPWQDGAIFGIPVYQWRRSVAVGFFCASVCGVLLSAGAVFWMLLAPLTGARWAKEIRSVWLRMGESGMAAWVFLFCVVGCMWTELFPWMADLNRLSPHFLWEWGGEALTEPLRRKEMSLLADRIWFLNMPFFFTREFLYGVLLVLIPAIWRSRWELPIDGCVLICSKTERSRRVCSALLLPLVVISIGLMGIDWSNPSGMSWIPSIFPLAFLANAAVLGLSLSYCVLFLGEKRAKYDSKITSRMGALLLTGVMFKLYFWYSMYMLVWYAGVPREIAFYTERLQAEWGSFVSFCAWSNLVMLLLLFIPSIRRSIRWIAGCGMLLFIIGVMEIYWMIAPGMGVKAPWGMSGCVFALSLAGIILTMLLMFISGRRQASYSNQCLSDHSDER